MKILRQHKDGQPRERGAAIVEFALVSVVLFIIIFGLIEGGLLVRARNSINNSVDEAARRGAIAGASPTADWQILEQMRVRGLLSSAEVNFVVVYKASDGSALPSEACRLGQPVAGECNVYTRQSFEVDRSAFNCSDGVLDLNWCPTDRSPATNSFEYLGVWVDATYRGLFGGFFGIGNVDMRAHSALPIEGSGGV